MTHKRKRQATSKLPLYLAQIVFAITLTCILLMIMKSQMLYHIYAPFAGIVVLFMWVLVAVGLFFGLVSKQYRIQGQYIKAKATMMIVVSIIMLAASSLGFAMTGF
ncbi:MAG: hypothetical protein AAF846_13480 [Chloroflexota bacterium]